MNRPVLITGAEGFVGWHLMRELGIDAVPVNANVLDPPTLSEEFAAASPTAIVHLAARSSGAESWQSPAAVWQTNVLGTVNVIEAMRRGPRSARLLAVSTGEVYGHADTIPTPEHRPTAPLSPYAASKAAAEEACSQAARGYDLDIVIARSFTHEGPGRGEEFAIGSWTHQVARLERKGGGVLRVGDVSVERDILDVRDVCRAYRLLLDRSVPSGVYNVASGRPVRLAHVLERLLALSNVTITVEEEASLRRAVDLSKLSGDPGKLEIATGWRPEIPLERTLADALDGAREAVAEESTI